MVIRTKIVIDDAEAEAALRALADEAFDLDNAFEKAELAADDFVDSLNPVKIEKFTDELKDCKAETVTMSGRVNGMVGHFNAAKLAVGGAAAALGGYVKVMVGAVAQTIALEDAMSGIVAFTKLGKDEAIGYAQEIRKLSGGAVGLTDALNKITIGAQGGIDPADQVRAIEFAVRTANSTGRDMLSTIDQLNDALITGSAEALIKFQLLPGGIDDVRKAVDDLHGEGAFDAMGESARRAAIKIEALGNLDDVNQKLVDAGSSGVNVITDMNIAWQDLRKEVYSNIDANGEASQLFEQTATAMTVLKDNAWLVVAPFKAIWGILELLSKPVQWLIYAVEAIERGMLSMGKAILSAGGILDEFNAGLQWFGEFTGILTKKTEEATDATKAFSTEIEEQEGSVRDLTKADTERFDRLIGGYKREQKEHDKVHRGIKESIRLTRNLKDVREALFDTEIQKSITVADARKQLKKLDEDAQRNADKHNADMADRRGKRVDQLAGTEGMQQLAGDVLGTFTQKELRNELLKEVDDLEKEMLRDAAMKSKESMRRGTPEERRAAKAAYDQEVEDIRGGAKDERKRLRRDAARGELGGEESARAAAKLAEEQISLGEKTGKLSSETADAMRTAVQQATETQSIVASNTEAIAAAKQTFQKLLQGNSRIRERARAQSVRTDRG